MRLRLPFAARLLLIGLVALLGLTFGTQPARAATCTGIQYGAFVKNVAYTVAQHEGFFAQEGLTICYNQVKSSQDQFDNLFAGNTQVIATAADNVVNRVVNLQKPVEMVAGLDNGTGLVLAANTNNGIHSIADLKGKPIAVDAPDSGFVFALRKILKANGLLLENGDYSLQIVGGGFQRYQALIAGSATVAGDPNPEPVYATMLSFPFTVDSTTVPQITTLAKFSDQVNPYEGVVLATTPAYAQANSATISAFIRATIRASFFARDPRNHDKVVADIAADLNVTPTIAAAQLVEATDWRTGEDVFAHVNYQGLVNTINLRAEFNGFPGITPPPNAYRLAQSGGGVYDNRYWIGAITSLLSRHRNTNS